MSMERTDVVIIGAGMAGVTCARRLAEAGLATVVLDKGRGIGGRMATRRVTLETGTLRFDHGAQYFTVRDAGFGAALDRVPGATAIWQDGAAEPHRVGLPGMSGLPRAMASGLDVRQQAEVTAISRTNGTWQVTAGEHAICAPRLVSTVPAPQAARLLGAAHPLAQDLGAVGIAPCLTLMAAFPADAPAPFTSRADEAHPLAWIAQDSSKPDRPDTATTWVAQASPDWSERHLEEDRDVIAARMLPLLCELIGVAPDLALHAAAHRWRYARVTKPLGRPFLGGEQGLWLGGDWCLGARVEAAWKSGAAIADAVLADGIRQ